MAICAGNIVSSSIFNILLIGSGVSAYVGMDVGMSFCWLNSSLATTFMHALWFFKSGHVVSRREIYLLFLCGILSLSALSQFGYCFEIISDYLYPN